MKRSAAAKHYRRWLEQLPGWRLEQRNGGHVAFVGPRAQDGMVVASATPSDRRALKNTRSILRRASGVRLS